MRPSARRRAEVAGPVEPPRRLAVEAVRDEALGGELRPVAVATAHPDAADVEVADDPGRLRLEPRVEDVELGVGDRIADGDEPAVPAHADSTTARSSSSVVPYTFQSDSTRERDGDGQLLAQRLPTAEGLEAGRARPARIDEHLPGGGRRLHARDVARRRAARAARWRRRPASRPPARCVAPIMSGRKNSSRDGSKDIVVTDRTTSSAVRPGWWSIDSSWLVRRGARSRRPSAVPVEPEV